MAKGKITKGRGRPKGKGKTAARHRGAAQDKPKIEGISKGDIKRLARRAGVKRVAFDIYAHSRVILHEWLRGVIKDTIVYTEHAKRKTIYTMDVVYALKKRGHSLYGFEI